LRAREAIKSVLWLFDELVKYDKDSAVKEVRETVEGKDG
jgi:hypothetical protein